MKQQWPSCPFVHLLTWISALELRLGINRRLHSFLLLQASPSRWDYENIVKATIVDKTFLSSMCRAPSPATTTTHTHILGVAKYTRMSPPQHVTKISKDHVCGIIVHPSQQLTLVTLLPHTSISLPHPSGELPVCI